MNDHDVREVLLYMAELRRAQEFADAAALGQVRLDRDHRRKAQIDYRCERRCGLFTAWNQPDGLLVRHPSFRMSAARLARVASPQDKHMIEHRRTESGAMVWPARAYRWDGEPIFVACEHHYRRLDPEGVREALAQALETGDTVRRVSTVPGTMR